MLREPDDLGDCSVDSEGHTIDGGIKHIGWSRHDLIGCIDVHFGDITVSVLTSHGTQRCGSVGVITDGHGHITQGANQNCRRDTDGANGL